MQKFSVRICEVCIKEEQFWRGCKFRCFFPQTFDLDLNLILQRCRAFSGCTFPWLLGREGHCAVPHESSPLTAKNACIWTAVLLRCVTFWNALQNYHLPSTTASRCQTEWVRCLSLPDWPNPIYNWWRQALLRGDADGLQRLWIMLPISCLWLFLGTCGTFQLHWYCSLCLWHSPNSLNRLG